MTPTTSSEDFVLQLALEKGALEAEQVDEIQKATQSLRSPAQVIDFLIERKIATAHQVTAWLGEALGLCVVDLREKDILAELRNVVPREIAEKYELLPLQQAGEVLQIALSDPWQTDGCDYLAYELGLTIEPFLTTKADLMKARARFYGAEELQPPVVEIVAEDVSIPADDAPIINWVHAVIDEAIRLRASDIHLEPLSKRLRVRYRVDGVLVEGNGAEKAMHAAIISRVKIMANMSIAEKRLPQDGRIQIKLAGRAVDLRVASLATTQGESAVMRLLEQETVKKGMSELGFEGDDEARMRKLIGLPDGLVLVTGPTGSGKTTTLYGCLQELNKTDRKLITVEEPVEYQIAGINQVSVRREIGMTFASALRAMLRQSPNVIMVGEIRDLATAEIAVHASLTGHLVFSTLHTNDAPGAVTRLIDLGVKPFLIASSVRAVVAQRLVRRVCPACARAVTATRAEKHCLGIEASAELQLKHGAGCADCAGTGYRGRIGLFEFFELDETIQTLLQTRAGANRLRAEARARGMRGLREDGFRKVLAGLTTLEEVLAQTLAEPI